MLMLSSIQTIQFQRKVTITPCINGNGLHEILETMDKRPKCQICLYLLRYWGTV